MTILKNDWKDLLFPEFQKDYYKALELYLEEEYRTKTIYPNREDIFNALKYTSCEDTKVVILGQDPYHGPGQAHGLSFSVQPEVSSPPSLINIFKELKNDLGCYIPNNGYLKSWADQGVLLLNTILTVREGQPNSHKNIGWHLFTDKIIELINSKEQPVVFILWGKNAQSKESLITNKNHYIIKSAHPSPLSARRGFFDSKPFSKTNEFLQTKDMDLIDWQIQNL
jgi:uracil-DNA glycosylase